MRRRFALLAAAACSALLLGGSLPGHATIAPGDGSSHAQAAEVTQGSGLTTSSRIDLLGLGLGNLTAPLTDSVVSPLLTALTALPSGLASNLSNALVGAGFQANNTDTQQPRPGSGFPTCGQRGWTGGNCFGPLLPAVAAPPLLVLMTGATQGYATGDAAGYSAAARVANPQLNLLGFALGDLGLIASSASCGTSAASCTATQSFSGGSLLGGHLALSLADGGPLVAKIDGVAIPAGSPQPIGVNGFQTTVTLNGNLATINVALTLTQLLTALGLPTLLTALGALGTLVDDGTTANLTIKIGPGSIARTSPASAWGLNVSADLTAAIKLKLALAGIPLATVAVTAGGTSPNLVGLKLAYSTATAGTLLPGWIPPALI